MDLLSCRMSLSTRRSFLKAAVAGAAAATIPVAARGQVPAPAKTGRTDGGARNLIFLVSDGMSLGTLSLAHQFRSRRDGRGTAWLDLYRDPTVRRALIDTASASSVVTDSAAASSAWGGGLRVANGSINVGAGGVRRQPLLDAVRSSGRATGLVSTATITHATPAGFAVNVPGRNDESSIADLYAQSGIDLFLGGGAKFFDATLRSDNRDTFAEFSRAGYEVVRNRTALAAAPAGRQLLGVFADGHLPYALDHASEPDLASTVPTLAEMAGIALRRLASSGGDRGFALQIEGARVDHAAHANDFGGLIHDQLAFDDALAVALRFAAGRSDTLVIVTTDHGNSNPGLNGTGSAYGETNACFERSFGFRQTNDWIISGLAAESTAGAIRDRVKLATDLAITAGEADLIGRALRKDYKDAYRVRTSAIVILGQVLANHIAVGWTGISHTSDLVELAAIGPGSEAVGGVMLNTAVHSLMRAALALPPV